MAKITKIKASDGPSKKEEKKEPKKAVVKKKSEKKPFFLVAPFVYLWRYLRDSWMELRQVRWPNRKTTWKMVLAVVIYSALFMAIISLLDLFFSWLFGLILGNN